MCRSLRRLRRHHEQRWAIDCAADANFADMYLHPQETSYNLQRLLAFVASAGYLAFLVGPPLLGFLGQVWGVTNMFYVIALFLVLTIVFASGAGNTKGAGSGH